MTAQAADQEISWIYCGDKIDPIREKYIKEWEGEERRLEDRARGCRVGAMPGQGDDTCCCRHAGRHGLCRLAHVEGIRAERPDHPGPDDRGGEEELLSEHRRHGDVRGQSSGAFRSPSRPRPSIGTRTCSRRPVSIRKPRRRQIWAEEIAIAKQIKEKTPERPVTACRPRPSTIRCTSSCTGSTPTTAR